MCHGRLRLSIDEPITDMILKILPLKPLSKDASIRMNLANNFRSYSFPRCFTVLNSSEIYKLNVKHFYNKTHYVTNGTNVFVKNHFYFTN